MFSIHLSSLPENLSSRNISYHLTGRGKSAYDKGFRKELELTLIDKQQINSSTKRKLTQPSNSNANQNAVCSCSSAA
jgi:hypothetical protein